MLRYADAIVKRGVDKLIDAIGHCKARNHKMKRLKHSSRKNAWATTLIAHHKQLAALRTAV